MKTELGPSEQVAVEHEKTRAEQFAEQQKEKQEEEKRQRKIPLSEPEKIYLAKLETMARSGKSPNSDQMKDLRLLRIREKITPLSVLEKRELEEDEVKLQADVDKELPASGLPLDERTTRLRKRAKSDDKAQEKADAKAAKEKKE